MTPDTDHPVEPTRRLSRMPSLDGVRTVAVILTSLIHLVPSVVPGGFIGVDMFFVLSGFLITSLLIGEYDRHGRIALGRFYVRRARRLLPAVLLLGLVFTVTAVLLDHSTRNLIVTAVTDAGLLTYTLNWAGVLQHDVPWQVDHLWSLSVEEQFYLLWPLVLIVLLPRVRRTTLMWITGMAAAGSAVLQGISFLVWHSVNISYLASPLRAEGILLGCLLAQWYCWRRAERTLSAAASARWLPAVTLIGLLIAASTLPLDGTVSYVGGMAVATVLAAALVWSLVGKETLGRLDGTGGDPVTRLLRSRPMTAIGRRSYSIYLWQNFMAWALTPSLAGTRAWIPGNVVATLVCAEISYRFVERRFWRPDVPSRDVRTPPISSTVAAADPVVQTSLTRTGSDSTS